MDMKNYIGFVNDHSGSMQRHERAAVADYNATISAFRDAANTQMLDTVVSVVGIGLGVASSGRYRHSGEGYGTKRQIVISNPHVLKPIVSWPTTGGTPLWDGIGDMISLFKSLPDANDPHVSFLVMVTTDGKEEHSGIWTRAALREEIARLQATGRWTFVFRVPRGGADISSLLGVSKDNVQTWDTTSAAGLTAATASTKAAVDSYYAVRASGAKSSSSFYTSATAVDTSKLTDITKEVSLYQVPDSGNTARVRIDDFILSKRSKFLKGAAFVQLVKTEPKIGPKKIVLIRERVAPNRIFAGKEAREMIGMPTDPTSNARVHPGDHGNYDIFIQSESLNRLLPDNVGVIYWEKQGVPFTQEDIDKFTPKPAAAPAVPVLPAVTGNVRPTASPVPKAAPVQNLSGPVVNGRAVNVYCTRSEARASKTGAPQQGNVVFGDAIYRWYTFK